MKETQRNNAAIAAASALSTLDDFGASSDPRAPLANITNAPHLFGDPGINSDIGDAAYGDAAYGFPSLYDGAMNVGDPSSAGLDTYATLIGAPIPQWAKIAGAGVVGAGAGYAIKALIERHRRKVLQTQAMQKLLSAQAGRNTITNAVLGRRIMGKIPLNTPFQFYSMDGATLNSYPLAPTMTFPADSLKYNFDQQAAQTPFESDIATGTIVGTSLQTTQAGPGTDRFFCAIIVTVGINALSANPGTVARLTASIPTVSGTLTISSTEAFAFTFGKDYYLRFILYPWQLVTNVPLLAQGKYGTANPVVITVDGVPTNSSMTTIIPGSLHQWTIAMRNRLVL